MKREAASPDEEGRGGAGTAQPLRTNTMNNSTRVMRLHRRAWPPAARAVAASIATAVLALLAAACSGSASSTGSGGWSNAAGSANSKALAYARCVRAHGVPNFPDPDSSGGFSKTTLAQLAASNSRYQAATQTCGHLLSNGGSGSTQAYVRQEWTGMLNFPRRRHSPGPPTLPQP